MSLRFASLTILLLASGAPLSADVGLPPDPPRGGRELDGIERIVLPEIDEAKIWEADQRRAMRGLVPHYAVAQEVSITPWSHGKWEVVQDARARWRLRIASPGALSLNLAFSRFRMPEGGRLTLFSADGRHRIGPFSERDNEDHGELWTPPIPGAELILDLSLPVDRLGQLELELAEVHHGYAGFGDHGHKSGDCQVDVACYEAAHWNDQARSVGLISIAGVRFCTGFLVNNTALDGRPLLVTAYHCGIRPEDAPSVVVMWGHERSVCGGEAEEGEESAHWRRFQTGAVLRAANRSTDMVLLELDETPDPAFGVYYVGWDRTPEDPGSTVAIHHPNTDLKRISFSSGLATTTRYLGSRTAPNGNHLRVPRWELGTTEGGSSGAPLFNADQRVVGQLHGGRAACGNQSPDWFGRLSSSWTGVGPATRLSDWLDPIDSSAMTLDGIDAASVPER